MLTKRTGQENPYGLTLYYSAGGGGAISFFYVPENLRWWSDTSLRFIFEGVRKLPAPPLCIRPYPSPRHKGIWIPRSERWFRPIKIGFTPVFSFDWVQIGSVINTNSSRVYITPGFCVQLIRAIILTRWTRCP